LIADAGELDPAWLVGKQRVGLTAGASAPESLVENVIAALRKIDDVEVSGMDGIKEHIEFRLPAALRN
jgi:4-hydroxy-3-methylbut-2-enyl diphosphate reductase